VGATKVLWRLQAETAGRLTCEQLYDRSMPLRKPAPDIGPCDRVDAWFAERCTVLALQVL
jgi:hypothetical protein